MDKFVTCLAGIRNN